MNENNEPNFSPFSDPYTPPEKTPIHFSVKDWLFVPVSLLLAWLCMRAYSAVGFFSYGPAGLGVAVFVTALLAAVFLRLGKAVHLNAYAILYTVCAFLLGVSCFTGGGYAEYFLNAFAALLAGTLAVFSLSGQLTRPEASPSQFFEAIGLFFTSIFRHFFAPFRALGGLMRSDKKRLGGVLIGLLCATPVLAVVLALLASADAVFSGIFENIGDWFARNDFFYWLWKIMRIVFVALLFFSGLYFLTQPREVSSQTPLSSPEDEKPRSAASFVTVLVLLCTVYLVFAVIQIVFLFGGAETAAMKGGYAQYARSGFFQLVAVAAINLCVVLAAGEWAKHCAENARTALRVLSLALLTLTLIILASAVYRMALYISVYALSTLRLLTLWAMFVILVSLFAAAWKTLRPEFRFFRVLLLVTLCSWTLLALLNPHRIIAEYNVSAFLRGQVWQIDIHYLVDGFSEGPDILPALYRLRDSGLYPNANELSGIIGELEAWDVGPWEYVHLYNLLPHR